MCFATSHIAATHNTAQQTATTAEQLEERRIGEKGDSGKQKGKSKRERTSRIRHEGVIRCWQS